MERLQEKTEVAYIAGYGRSGSTLLDVLIGNLPNYVGLGEVLLLQRAMMRGDISCSCGFRLSECEFWADVVQELYSPSGTDNDPRRYSHGWSTLVKSLLRVGRVSKDNLSRLDKRILEVARMRGTSVVESSKTAYKAISRPLVLSTDKSTRVRIIHAVRDPRDVYRSFLLGDNQKLQAGEKASIPFALIRAPFGWLLANLGAELLRIHFGSENYLRVRYEDLISDPEKVIARLASFLHRDGDALIDKVRQGHTLSPGHIIGGNRMTRRDRIVLEERQQVGRSLGILERFVIGSLCGPLIWRYKYWVGWSAQD